MKKAAVTLLLAALTVTLPTWKDVDRLVSEQKLEEASRAAAEIRAAARKSGNETEETRALIREVQLRTALHGYETAVRFLKEEPWPKGLSGRTVLNLFYARSLVTYAQAYGWEIGQREKVDTKGVVDLKAWTREQIFAEAARAFAEVWKERAALGKEPSSSLAEFVDTNSYPPGVRPTVRDAAAYLFVELLADSAGWRPDQSNELFALDLPALVAGNAADVGGAEARRPGGPPAPPDGRGARRPRGVARRTRRAGGGAGSPPRTAPAPPCRVHAGGGPRADPEGPRGASRRRSGPCRGGRWDRPSSPR